MRDISIPSIEEQLMDIHTTDAMIEAAPVAVCYFCHVVIVLVCHLVTKIVLDEMGHLLTLSDEMGLDEMG